MHKGGGCSFPNEILLLIKENIPISDLRTHVCYYHTCRTIAAFYGDESQQAAFWRKSFLHAGLGYTGLASSYKDLAFECIARDGFCSHPDCGGALLDWNARQVEKAMIATGWDPEGDPWDTHLLDSWGELDPLTLQQQSSYPDVMTNIIFSSVAYKKLIPLSTYDVPFPRDSFLRCHDPNGFRLPIHRRTISEHPIVRHSIATFPALNRLNIEYDAEDPIVEEVFRPGGVTVHDVVRVIRKGLDERLAVYDLHGLLLRSFSCLQPTRPTMLMSNLSRWATLRGLWAKCRLDAVESSRVGSQGPIFSLCFSDISDELYQTEYDEELRAMIEESAP
ncbi:hypothetical protein C8Q75DRAFT_809811 [Abortiporus biennis]|nr:hypothetical protein C8Q75DRAFT_809811 [Abortiporus biennis]